MKFIDLFAGIGGFRYGLEKVTFRKKATFKCVWSNDFNLYASAIYERNFGNGLNRGENKKSKKDQERVSTKNWQGLVSKARQKACASQRQSGQYNNCVPEQRASYCIDSRDIRKVKSSEIPDHDLLVGGFPCQAFSIAGKRLGFEDTRGTLFFEIARILRDKRPRYLLLENVKGLLSHDSGKTFQRILGVLSNMGYECEWQVLNSKNFGVPQNRERVFIIGYLRGEPRPQVFPIRKDGEVSTKRQGQISSTITSRYYKQGQSDPYVVSGTLRTHKDGNGFREVKSGLSPTIPARAREDGSGQPVIYMDTRIRRLTPTECERLQGFPDGWTEGVSDTQRYKLLGNAVTTNVITEIGKRLIKLYE